MKFRKIKFLLSERRTQMQNNKRRVWRQGGLAHKLKGYGSQVKKGNYCADYVVRRDRSRAQGVIILLYLELMKLGLECGVQQHGYSSKNAQTSLEESRTDQQEGLKVSKGEVWWDVQPAWDPASSCPEPSRRITAVDVQAGLGHPHERGQVRI